MTTYLINERMVGESATEADARRRVEILSDWGQDVAYGFPAYEGKQADTFLDAGYWLDALDILAEINAPPTVAMTPERVAALESILHITLMNNRYGQYGTYELNDEALADVAIVRAMLDEVGPPA